MSKILGLDTANIDNISGLGTGGGGSIEDFALPEADTGILIWGGGSGAPDVLGFSYNGNDVMSVLVPSKGKVSGDTISKGNWQFSIWGGAYLTDSGNLYTQWKSATFANAIGRAVTASEPAKDYHLAATNVAQFAIGYGTIMYISTSGTFHYSGRADYSGNTGGTNGNYNFVQLGTDTDWISVHADGNGFPYSTSACFAVKGASGGKIYSFGSNSEGKTGQNTTSGNTTVWTLMSDGAGGTFDVQGWTQVKVSQDSPAAIDSTGRLWRWGEGIYGALGTGSSADILYPQQVGSDTDWEYLGNVRNVMMAIKGGEIWYCSYTNFGYPWSSTGVVLDRTWRQQTSTGGLWEEIDCNISEQQNYLWTGKYNGSYVIHGLAPSTRGSYNLPDNTDLRDTSTGVGGTYFVPVSDLSNPVAGTSTINWIESHCAGNTSSQSFILISAS